MEVSMLIVANIVIIILIVVSSWLYWENKTIKKTIKEAQKDIPKIINAELTDEQKEKFEKSRKAFIALMEYGYDTALKKKE